MGVKISLSKIMIFEKNPLTTALSKPKCFHLTQKALCSEIHQPTLMLYLNYVDDASKLLFARLLL